LKLSSYAGETIAFIRLSHLDFQSLPHPVYEIAECWDLHLLPPQNMSPEIFAEIERSFAMALTTLV
jgi:hypothetical protein